MADRPDKTLPDSLPSGVASVSLSGQEYESKVKALAEKTLKTFMGLLPSNYVSQVKGPFYTMQFQAAAEEMARIQVSASEVFSDSDYDFTRPEFIHQILRSLIFRRQDGNNPTISGDISYREFLKGMVALLLAGGTKLTIEQAVGLLTDDLMSVVEASIERRSDPKSGYALSDEFLYEVNISVANGTQFPVDPVTLQENLKLVLDVLAPAETIYEYRHVFQDSLVPVFTDSLSMDLNAHYYDDFRRYWLGAKHLSGTAGVTLSDRSLFQDLTRDFSNILPGSNLTITSGANVGVFRVVEAVAFPISRDRTSTVAFTTSATVTGTASITGDVITTNVDMSGLPEGTTITFAFTTGSETYRLQTLLGEKTHGPVGDPIGLDIVGSSAAPDALFTTTQPHDLQVLSGYSAIRIVGHSDVTLNGFHNVATVPSSTTFTVGAPGIGGVKGQVIYPTYKVRLAKSILRLQKRMANVLTGQSYTVTVDRLGMQEAHLVGTEDASSFFFI